MIYAHFPIVGQEELLRIDKFFGQILIAFKINILFVFSEKLILFTFLMFHFWYWHYMDDNQNIKKEDGLLVCVCTHT